MQKNRKRIFTWILLFTVSIQVFWWDGISVSAEPAAIEAPSAVLLESSTGKVIFEQNARERRSPASITKIMTLLLTFEALDQDKTGGSGDRQCLRQFHGRLPGIPGGE